MTTRFLAITIMGALAAVAQPTVAPSPEATGSPRGQNTGGYNVVNSFETGYRFRNATGNVGKFRSDVNFGNGIRLLGSNVTVHSREGHGWLFDELALNTQGLGNDPYEAASLRVQKNKFYRYDMLWRLNEFYNPALTISGGQHLLNTTRMLQDHDFTLLPQSKLRLVMGYSRNRQEGPALATVQLFDSRGDEFPLFADVDRLNHEFRLGGQAELGGLRLHILHAWDRYREASPMGIATPLPGNNPGDLTTLNSLSRREPYQGSSSWWRGQAIYDKAKWFAATGRMTYVSGQRHFTFDETAMGTDRLGVARNRQILASGTGRRPVAAGSATFSLFPSERLTLANHTAVHSARMNGNGQLQEFNNANSFGTVIHYQYLGIRLITNLTDATYRAASWLSLYGGFQYADRLTRSEEYAELEPPRTVTPYEQTNKLRAGLAGVRLQPLKPLRISLDGEAGRADRPFYPVSEKNYHGLGARVQWKTRSLLLSAAARSNYNFNTVSLAAHSNRLRNYTFDASWNRGSSFGIDAGYSKQHVDTLTGIAYFASFRLYNADRSLYISNIHAAHAGARVTIRSKVDLFAGFHHVQDIGDGRVQAAAGPPASSLPAFTGAQTFPLAFQSPLARISVRLHNRLRWNFGYQYYRYDEEFLAHQDYRAHTGYTSLTWSF
jgi:hypothetical protein